MTQFIVIGFIFAIAIIFAVISVIFLKGPVDYKKYENGKKLGKRNQCRASIEGQGKMFKNRHLN